MEELKGIKEAAQRIKKAAENYERIIIYGDADLDGVASVVILKELFEELNPKYLEKGLEIYFPDRKNEGYGLLPGALDFLKQFSPALLFTLDCGIGNVEEVEMAKKMGFEVVIIDHHQILEKNPDTKIIIDPFLPEDNYPFKQFSASGLVYKVVEAILEKNLDKFIELAALATLADMMPLIEDNKELVEKGLESFRNTERKGLIALKKINDLNEEDRIELFQKIIGPLNSSDRINNLTQTYLLLTTNSSKEAEVLARELIRKNKEKRVRIQEIFEQVEERISEKESPIVFEGDSSWPVIMIGVVASRICQRYKKPVFLFKVNEKESIFSARLPKGFDGVKAMANCKDLLTTYGGHPPACGCRLSNENVDRFRKCLEKYFSEKNEG